MANPQARLAVLCSICVASRVLRNEVPYLASTIVLLYTKWRVSVTRSTCCGPLFHHKGLISISVQVQAHVTLTLTLRSAWYDVNHKLLGWLTRVINSRGQSIVR